MEQLPQWLKQHCRVVDVQAWSCDSSKLALLDPGSSCSQSLAEGALLGTETTAVAHAVRLIGISRARSSGRTSWQPRSGTSTHSATAMIPEREGVEADGSIP